jgi:hypothetical protein
MYDKRHRHIWIRTCPQAIAEWLLWVMVLSKGLVHKECVTGMNQGVNRTMSWEYSTYLYTINNPEWFYTLEELQRRNAAIEIIGYPSTDEDQDELEQQLMDEHMAGEYLTEEEDVPSVRFRGA